jgi:hypothetical protein
LNWRDVLPPRVASEQEAWERCTRAFQARLNGATLRSIGDGLGVTASRAQQIADKGARRQGRRSPAERYLSERNIEGWKSATALAHGTTTTWRPQTYSERVWEIKAEVLEEEHRLRRAKDKAERQLRQLQEERERRASYARAAEEDLRRRAEAEDVALRVSQMTKAMRQREEAEKRRWDGVPTVAEHLDKVAQSPEWQRMLRSGKHLNGKAE